MSKQTFKRLVLAGLIGAFAPSHIASAQTESEEPCRASNGADNVPNTEDDAFACGRDAEASGDGATALGDLAIASRPGTTAVGRASNATADNATAIGAGAVADYASSVALGAGSVAGSENTVSVGSSTLQRRVTNVAGGIEGSDAATFGQLTAATNAFTATTDLLATAIAGLANPVDLAVSNAIAIDDVTTRVIPTNLNGFTVPADIGQIFIGNTSQSADAITIDSGSNFPGGIAFRRYLGPGDSPQPITNGTQLGYLDFRGYRDGFFYNAGSLDMVMDGLINDTSGLMPTKMRFATSDGERVSIPMELLSNGRLEINALGNPVGALGDSKLYVFQGNNDWNTVLSSSVETGSAYVLRLHTRGTSANDYLIGGSSGEGTGSFKFSVRGNGDTHIAGKLLVQGRDVLSELSALASLDGDDVPSLALRVDTLEGNVASNTQRIQDLESQTAGPGATQQLVKSGSPGTASASGEGALAAGVGTRATAAGATAVGSGAVAIRADATALGSSAISQGAKALAIGSGSVAVGDDAVALGGAARATASSAVALGASSESTSAGATAVGNNSKATRTDAVALGNGAVTVADRGVALGSGAVVAHANSTAVGAGARTTAANQVMLGAKGNAVVVADMTASTAAQQGPVNLVTVDANGTLGRGAAVATEASVESVRTEVAYIAAVSDEQFSALSNQVSTMTFRLDDLERSTSGGIAAAMALGGTIIVPDSTVSVSVNGSTYRGAQGFSGVVSARVGERVYVSGGIAGSTVAKTTGGRVGVAVGF